MNKNDGHKNAPKLIAQLLRYDDAKQYKQGSDYLRGWLLIHDETKLANEVRSELEIYNRLP